VRRVIPAIGLLALGCAHQNVANNWVPCPEGFSVDAHHTMGTIKGDATLRAYEAGERDGVDSNYRGTEVGGSVYFKFNDPDRCPVWGGEPRK